MKIHTTNYFNTFVEVSDDCPAGRGTIPPINDKSKSIANIQFDLISKNPYKLNSDDVLFQVYASRNDLTEYEFESEKKIFFSKGQACFRSSPLTKRYGWGIHCNELGKIALFGVETKEYQKFLSDVSVKKVKAMRSKKA
jgi:hypothetical protein